MGDQVDQVIVRPAEKKDCGEISALIQELADYEKMGDKPQLSGPALERDGFPSDGSSPYYRAIVAEVDGHVFAYALYYSHYSHWQGKGIHLEDFYVTPQYRHKGVGTRMLKMLAKIGVDGDFCRITLECLDWNEPTRKYYEKLNAVNYTELQGWHTYRFVREVMEKLAAE